ncbi:MAG TPA: alcohol dehydrogenase catalytic domain-containing protein [Victivallales bacterium]|nr:alcohol dehydrogenase catalytic domain-containing protein [Victivallales bacterium]
MNIDSSVKDNMNAAVLMEANNVKIKEVNTPMPDSEDVLIKVEACALCSSDISLIDKPFPGQPPYGNFIIGHEYAGTVVGVGDNVDEFNIGDRVAVEAHLGCMRCANCRIGDYTSCLNYGNTKKGHRANGFTTNGCFAQYVINHINTVHKISDSIQFDEAALISNLGCSLYGFDTLGGYFVGDKVVVIGPGPLGLIAAQVSKALCADRTFLVGTREERLEVGNRLGIDRIINIHKENPLSVINKETNGIGADIVIESSGTESGLDLAVNATKRNGKILLLGFPHKKIEFDFENLALNNKIIYTVRGDGKSNVKRAVSLLKNRKVNLKALVTHSYPLSQFSEAVRVYTGRVDNAIKVIIKPN